MNKQSFSSSLAPIKFVRKIFGYDVFENGWSLFSLRLVLCPLMFSYGIAGCAFAIQLGSSDSQRIGNTILFFSGSISGVAKLGYAMGYRHSLREISEIGDKLLVPFFVERGLMVKFQKILKFVWFFQMMLLAGSAVSIIAFHIICVISMEQGVRRPLLPGVYTFLSTDSPAFQIGILLQTLFALQVAASHIQFDGLAALHLATTYMTLDTCAELLRDQAIPAERRLELFHRAHVQFIRYWRSVQKVLGPPVGVQLLNSSFSISSLLLASGQAPISSQWGLWFLVWLELAYYCYFGEGVKSKAEQLRLALHELPWEDMRAPARRAYLVTCTFATRDFVLRTSVRSVGLSLETMAAVIRRSYQLYTVLQNTTNI